ncbi:amidase family protein [Demequina lutea]|uniref:Asp-tRNA(Asn)/Glu-tRNA(Gln) amidotransferase A subunit family amidase n=1 Tax=Demequina lutea TaxID=431489 RepID=A0A7Y9ZD94_9MICO|nr:amidase family protein [Demequina lutea]NYI42113.1 Asp-tRNA(Asn)/Glu-tRNA(Gln) amidotransferase A subunit family amidase [Demequina lutea]
MADIPAVRPPGNGAPSQEMDTRVWRVVGEPLVKGLGLGPLRGRTVAVKDIFAIAGQRIGAGSRAYLAEAPVELETAPSVQALLDAGADVAGIAQTDQFAYSIAGLNPDYGTAPNPAVRGGIPGGSSSGPASAVALGQADIGVGSDTAGSIRIPASYQGLWGLRTTHGAVTLAGVLPLAPRYDTVGWLTRDGFMMLATATVGLERRIETKPSARVLICEEVNGAATPDATAAVRDVVAGLASAGVIEAPVRVGLPPVRELFEAFRVTQSAEAWRADGAWVDAHPGALAPDIEARFEWARAVTDEREEKGLVTVRRLAAEIDAALGDDVLVLPTAASAAPSVGADAETLNALREATLGMTAIAGLTGRPALSVPLAMTDAGPIGVCLVGPRGSDLALIERAIEWQQR